MWHKAPCSSRDYSGVRESGPCKIDEDSDDDSDVDDARLYQAATIANLNKYI